MKDHLLALDLPYLSQPPPTIPTPMVAMMMMMRRLMAAMLVMVVVWSVVLLMAVLLLMGWLNTIQPCQALSSRLGTAHRNLALTRSHALARTRAL